MPNFSLFRNNSAGLNDDNNSLHEFEERNRIYLALQLEDFKTYKFKNSDMATRRLEQNKNNIYCNW